MKFAFIMDPLEGVKTEKDTSYILMLAAQQRGHQVYHIDQDNLDLEGTKLFSIAREVEVLEGVKKPFEVKSEKRILMNDLDVVIVRKDPPFDRRYFYTTLFLDFITEDVLVLNSPSSLRDWNEKLAAMMFPEFTPKTLVTTNVTEALKFVEENQGAVLKPLDGFAGKGIEILKPSQDSNKDLIEKSITEGKRKVLLQKFVPEADKGDKRILLLDGEPLGAILRHNESGGLNNLDQGAVAKPTEITEREKEICRALSPIFKEQGLFFVGIDMLGDYMTEVNVTSPTGLQEAIRFSGQPLHMRVIEEIENKLS